jgi:hypothetical protein
MIERVTRKAADGLSVALPSPAGIEQLLAASACSGGSYGRDWQRGVSSEVQSRRSSAAGYQLSTQGRNHRTVVGAQAGPGHPQAQTGRIAPLLRQRPQPGVGGNATADDQVVDAV